jgi:uncharacterized membrane protein
VRAGRFSWRDLLILLVAIAAVLVILRLPDVPPPPGQVIEITSVRARITEVRERAPLDPNDPQGGFAPNVTVELVEGARTGERVGAYTAGPSGQLDIPDYKVGDEVVVQFTGQPEGGEFVQVIDRWRLPTLAFLTAVFALAVAAVGGFRGIRALVALVLTVALVLKVVVPLVLQGVPPIPLAVAVALGVTVATIGLTEGLTRTSVAAIAGTAAALVLTAVLANLVTAVAGFTNAAGSDLVYLQTGPGAGTDPNAPRLDLRGLLLAAFIFGALGVLDDVTVTQAAAVEELAERGGLGGSRLFVSAMNIGRSHVAATVNTLFLAYVGASLPLLVLFAISRQPPEIVLNGEVVAVEVVRTMVGSLGIVAAVPLTTMIAAALAAPGRRRVHRVGQIGA